MHLDTLTRAISPPPTRRAKKRDEVENKPSLAAIEAGKARIGDHLSYFSTRLSALTRPTINYPRIPFQEFEDLYKRNQHKYGHHFVLHQHDHPVAGVHYDLRIQFSSTSSISFAIPYGLPGDPNSIRPNRMGIETRVHNLWNNLIESASHATGSLLIWDTGEYEVLPRPEKRQQTTDDELSEEESPSSNGKSHSEKLFAAFQTRHMRIRLHGTRLPRNYTISMRLPSHNNRTSQPNKPKRKRRRVVKPSKAPRSDSDSETSTVVATPAEDEQQNVEAAMASEDEGEVMRVNNAYPGSSNTIGSVHQRHWFITLDRAMSGFRKENGDSRWTGDWEPFHVLGREHERSIVTGRLADEVMADDGVEKFVGRKMWRPIVE